jgi:cob(I)alamin adenosyltransferase
VIRLDKIYTKGGDSGQTGLSDGSRVSKTSPRIAAIGAVDEANSAMGVARLKPGRISAPRWPASRTTCSIWAPTCPRPQEGRKGEGALRICEAQVERLEREIDAINEKLSPLTSFILPGGTRAGGASASGPRHRAARGSAMVALAAQAPINHAALALCQPAVGPAVRDGARRQ